MSAEARNLSEELFKLVDKDNSGKISEAEFAAACGTIAEFSPELLPADFAKLDENMDGEVDRAEWSRRMGAVMQSRGSATFVAECFQSLRAVRDAYGDGSQLHPWIDLDFSSLGQDRRVINAADKRGITSPQLRKLWRFIASHDETPMRYTVVIQKAAWDGFAVGDKVERRDIAIEDWKVGFVTQLEPLKVTYDDTDPTAVGYRWNEVMPLLGLGLGLHFDELDESVAINQIAPNGAVSAHNAANPAAPVKLRDVLRSVNGSGPTLAEINAAVEAAGRPS